MNKIKFIPIFKKGKREHPLFLFSHRYWLAIVVCLFSIDFSPAQQNKIDSLLSLLKNEKEDTNKVNHLLALSDIYSYQNIDSAILFAEQAKNISEKIHDRNRLVDALSELGWNNYVKADYPKSLDYYLQALKIDNDLLNEAKNSKEKKAAQVGLAIRFGSIAFVYKEQADYTRAIDFNLKALKINEEIGSKTGIAANLSNLATVYKIQKDYPKALDCFLRSLKIFEELKDKNRMAVVLGNIGNVYKDQIGMTYEQTAANKKQLYENALEYYFRALKLDEELDHKSGIARHLGNIGILYAKEKKYDQAITYLLKAIRLSREMGGLDNTRQFELSLSGVYFEKGEFKKAYEYHQQYSYDTDALFNEESSKQIAEMSAKYETEKKVQQIELMNKDKEKQIIIAEADNRRKNIVIWSVVAGLFLLLVFTAYVFRSLRISHNQKEIIEEKQKEILDSIRYAKRIQQSLLPTEKYIEKNLNRLRNTQG